MLNINHVRKNFPYLGNGIIYFNHASLGPLSTSVVSRINEFVYQRSVDPIDNFRSFMESNRSAKAKLAAILNCKADRIAWINNVSDGLSMLAQSLSLKSGDRIILFEGEFPSNVYPFLNLQAQGVEIDFVQSCKDGFTFEEIADQITPRTKLLSVSAVQFLSGYRCDLDAIGKLCKENGIIFCVDAIQATGVVEIDIQKSKIDFLIGGAQKWLMSLQGASYFYISEELQSLLTQRSVGWTSVKDAWNLADYNLDLKDEASRFQNGTLNTIGITALDESLSLFTEIGTPNISQKVIDNTYHLRNLLLYHGVELIIHNAEINELSGITTIKVENPEDVNNRLKEANIICSMRQGLIRFAPHFYNTKEEIETVVKKLVDTIDSVKN